MHMIDLIANPVERKIVEAIVRPDERDLQKRLGPSDISNQCEVCLAEAFMQSREDTFGLKAWLGTCFHEKMERERQDEPFIHTERTVEIGEVPGYGPIKGHVDLLDEEYNTVVDYKTADKKDLPKLKKSYLILPNGGVEFYESKTAGYYVQTHLYGLGYKNAGHEVEKVAIFFIARDSNRIADRLYVEFPFREDVAVQALGRAGAIYDWAVVQGNGTDELASDPDCYVCWTLGRL